MWGGVGVSFVCTKLWGKPKDRVGFYNETGLLLDYFAACVRLKQAASTILSRHTAIMCKVKHEWLPSLSSHIDSTQSHAQTALRYTHNLTSALLKGPLIVVVETNFWRFLF